MALCLSAVFNKGTQYADEEPLFAGRGSNVCEAAFEYHPRHPEESVLYHVVAENIESFLARQQERGRVVSRFVVLWLKASASMLASAFLPAIACDWSVFRDMLRVRRHQTRGFRSCPMAGFATNSSVAGVMERRM
jgi:hypothetical protein